MVDRAKKVGRVFEDRREEEIVLATGVVGLVAEDPLLRAWLGLMDLQPDLLRVPLRDELVVDALDDDEAGREDELHADGDRSGGLAVSHERERIAEG